MNRLIVSRMPFQRIRTPHKHGFPIIAAVAVITFVVLVSSCDRFTDARQNGIPAFVSTAAGDNGEFGEPFGIAIRDGVVYVSDGEKDCIWRLGPAGAEIFASGLDTPSGIAFDENGNLIVADTGSHTIRSVDPTGNISILAGISGRPGSNDGDVGTATFHGPIGVALGSNGRIYVADTYNDRIRVIVDGKVSTVAGTFRGFADGKSGNTMFDTPTGIAPIGDKLLVADTGNGRLRVVEQDGTAWTLAGTASGDLRDGLLSNSTLYRPTSIVVDQNGSIFFTDGNSIRYIDSGPIPTVRTVSSDRRGFRDGAIGRSVFNRPSGLAIGEDGAVRTADSENGLVRQITSEDKGTTVTVEQLSKRRGDPARFRNAALPRWPYDPPDAPRDIAGTLGEIRGEIDGSSSQVWFHNGLDIAGAYGETARFIRDEKVLDPMAAENFGTLRELLRMPTLGYIHIRLGRDQASDSFRDPRFLFESGPAGKLVGVRVPRGSRFMAGEPIGTLNAMNHVHLVAGRSGFELNALDAMIFPGLSDSRQPTIKKVSVFDENWREIETAGQISRIKLTGKVRVTVDAYDQVDGNADRRRLGVYRLGYKVFAVDSAPASDPAWTITFDRLPRAETVPKVYAAGSRSGAQGSTVFSYIVTNKIEGDQVNEGFIDTAQLKNGIYILRVHAADYFGNTSTKDVTFEVNK